MHVPDALHEGDGPLDELIQRHLPASHAALEAASKSLFYSLPVAFDPGHSIGPFLATVDRDPQGSRIASSTWVPSSPRRRSARTTLPSSRRC